MHCGTRGAMEILGLPLELLSIIVRAIPEDAHYVALVCRVFLDAEHSTRDALYPRITPLWTGFVSMQRLSFCLRDNAFSAIFRRSSLKLDVRNAAFRAGAPSVIDYVSVGRVPSWDNVSISHQSVASIATGGSASLFERMVTADGAVFRLYFDTKMHTLASPCGTSPDIDPGVEFLLAPIITGGQSRAFRVIRARVRELWDEKHKATSAWGMIFGSPSFFCRTMLFEIASKLRDGGEMLSLLTSEVEEFSALPEADVRLQVVALVLSNVHRGVSGCALRWCASQVHSMQHLARRMEADEETGVEPVVGTRHKVRNAFSSHTRFLRARTEGAFLFTCHEMREGGWLRGFADGVNLPPPGQSVAQHYSTLHAQLAFEEAHSAELLWPHEPLRLLQRCAMALVEEALSEQSFARVRDAVLFLNKLTVASTRAGLECMARLRARHVGGEAARRLFALYKGPRLNNAALLLVNCIRLGLLRKGLSIIQVYGSHCIPDSKHLRYELASYALLSRCQRVVTALHGAGLRFEHVSDSGVVVCVRKLGEARAIELGVSADRVCRAARQRGRVLPCMRDHALFRECPSP